MFANKLALFGTLLVAVLIVLAEAQQNNFTMGERETGDKLVLQKPVEVDYKVAQITELEESFTTTNNAKITKFEAVDRKTDGTGAYVTILGGGLGQNYVTLKFKSKRNHGIHHMVTLYGK